MRKFTLRPISKQVLTITLTFSMLCASLFPLFAGDYDYKTIRGTSLADLSNAYEIIKKISTVVENGGVLSIAGQGEAILFVDGRRLMSHSELTAIPGRSIESIEILSESALEYGNSGSIILIRTIRPEDGQVIINQISGLSMSPQAGGYSSFNLKAGKGKFVVDGGMELSYLSGTKDVTSISEIHSSSVPGSITKSRDVARTFTLDTRIRTGYEFNDRHKLYISYKYKLANADSVQDSLTVSTQDVLYPGESFSNSSNDVHTISLNYDGKLDDWTVKFNYDLYLGRNKGKDNSYLRHDTGAVLSYDSRYRHGFEEGYLRADVSHPLWKGDFNAGINLDSYWQSNYSIDYASGNQTAHGDGNCFIPTMYAAIRQELGKYKLEAGLTVLDASFLYKVFDDDSSWKKYGEKENLSELKWHRNIAIPNFKLQTNLSDVTLSSGIYSNLAYPEYSSTSVKPEEIKDGDVSRAITQSETQYIGFLKGDWKWIGIKGWTSRYDRPIFRDSPYGSDFNGPDYWAMDWRFSVSPTISIWKTSLTATVHKQWLDMETSDSAVDLQAPSATFNWTNSLSFPWGMKMDMGAYMRTKGADRNMYFCKCNWKIDMILHQNFFRDRLTASLNFENLLRTDRDRIAFYTGVSGAYSDISTCRTIKLMLSFNL